LPKHYHVAQWVHTYVFVCFRALCGKYMLGLLLILISKSWGCPPLGLGMLFLDNDTCTRGGGYLFMLRFSSLYDAIHGWMMGRTDGWTDGWTGHVMKKVSWKTTTMSFTICNLSITTSYWWLLLLAVFHFGL
jgi:hypothetical protein